jgi:glutamate racemase
VIGVFDSGIGGLTVLRALSERLPEESLLYLGDNAFAPYGKRSIDEITTLTRRGLDRLFREGCTLVIVACNTASAVALRSLQQDWLAQAWPGRNALGVFVPVIEGLSGRLWTAPGPTRYSPGRPAKTVAVFATRMTVDSNAFTREVKARAPHLTPLQQACPRLAQAIEEGWDESDLDRGIARYVGALMAKAGGTSVDLVVLGCTHFPLVQHLFARHLPDGTRILDQPQLCADGLAEYLGRHKQFAKPKSEPAGIRLLTTGDPEAISANAARFYGEAVTFAHVSAPPSAPSPKPVDPPPSTEPPSSGGVVGSDAIGGPLRDGDV